jgi:hypothetical protein
MQVDEAPLQPVKKTIKRKKLKKYKKQKNQISRKMKKLKNHKKQKIENYKKALLFQFLVLVDWWNFRYDLCAPKVASRRGCSETPLTSQNTPIINKYSPQNTTIINTPIQGVDPP